MQGTGRAAVGGGRTSKNVKHPHAWETGSGLDRGTPICWLTHTLAGPCRCMKDWRGLCSKPICSLASQGRSSSDRLVGLPLPPGAPKSVEGTRGQARGAPPAPIPRHFTSFCEVMRRHKYSEQRLKISTHFGWSNGACQVHFTGYWNNREGPPRRARCDRNGYCPSPFGGKGKPTGSASCVSLSLHAAQTRGFPNGARTTMHFPLTRRANRQPPPCPRRALSQLPIRLAVQLCIPNRAARQQPHSVPSLSVGSCAKARL